MLTNTPRLKESEQKSRTKQRITKQPRAWLPKQNLTYYLCGILAASLFGGLLLFYTYIDPRGWIDIAHSYKVSFHAVTIAWKLTATCVAISAAPVFVILSAKRPDIISTTSAADSTGGDILRTTITFLLLVLICLLVEIWDEEPPRVRAQLDLYEERWLFYDKWRQKYRRRALEKQYAAVAHQQNLLQKKGNYSVEKLDHLDAEIDKLIVKEAALKKEDARLSTVEERVNKKRAEKQKQRSKK